MASIAYPDTFSGVAQVIGTIPAEARFELPDYLFDSEPVVVEAAYRPRSTLLVAQARARDCLVVEGIDMLVAQVQHPLALVGLFATHVRLTRL